MNLPSVKKGTTAGRLALWTMIGLLTWRCAQQARPKGGPRDQEPPTVTRSDPRPGQLNFDDDEVTVFFSEPVRKPTYDQEVFISPFVDPPEIKLADSYKRFTIQFREPLRPQTTYIVTLTDIKDNTEGNELAEAYLLAFSTGDQLDSLRLPGQVYTPKLGEPAKSLTVLLYDADSARQNQFYQPTGLRKRPAYLTQTNDQGEFEFQYLRAGQYRVGGMEGQSEAAGQIAITLDTVITIEGPQDSARLEPTRLLAFRPDDRAAPAVLSYRLWSERVADLALSEGIRRDALQAWMTDTLGQDSTPLRRLTLYRSEGFPQLLVELPLPLPAELHLRGLTDSLGYRRDTTLRLQPQQPQRRTGSWLQAPELVVEEAAWRALAPLVFSPEQRALFTLSDTAQADSNRRYFDLSLEQKGFFLYLRPDTLPDPSAEYVLRWPGRAVGRRDSLPGDSLYYDRTYRSSLPWYDPTTYGSLSGRVALDAGYQGPIVLEVIDDNQKVVATARDTVFAFDPLKAGTYRFRVLLDADGNGVYTPGQRWPPRWPERRYDVPEDISLRGNWTFEDHVIRVVSSDSAAQAAAPASPDEGEGAAGEGAESTGPPGMGDPGGRNRR